MKGLIVEKNQKKSYETILPASDDLYHAKGPDSTDARYISTVEVQSLREKLDISEKLNAALKYELEANRKSMNKLETSGKPLMDHLEELRQLRARLEESIRAYDALCVQLEEKLSELKQDSGKNGLNDKLSLIKENDTLRDQLAQFTEKMKRIQNQLEEQRIAAKK